jgi:hypothetical protein
MQDSALSRLLSNKKVIRTLASQLERNRAILMGHVESFHRNIGDLLGTSVLTKTKAFAFFRLLANLYPAIAAAEQLKYDSHIDYYMPSLPCRSPVHFRTSCEISWLLNRISFFAVSLSACSTTRPLRPSARRRAEHIPQS